MCNTTTLVRPTGLARARIGPLLAVGGRLLRDKREQDAEALALLDGSLERGTLLIGFERVHRVGRFPVRGGEVQAPSGYIERPAEARRMPTNQGFEAVAVLQAGPLRGAIVAFAERYTRGSGYHTGWIWTGGQAQRFQLQDIDGFNITDAAGLPDGGLLVLERYFSWMSGVRMRIRRLAPNEIRPGARLTGHTVVQVDSRPRDRQHGGPRRAPRRPRRDGGVADLGQQLPHLPAADGVFAVHAGGVSMRGSSVSAGHTSTCASEGRGLHPGCAGV